MPYAEIQPFDRSRTDYSELLSLDLQTVSAPTLPLIHQEARFLYILSGRGTILVQGRPIELVPDMLLSILPWQITEVTDVAEPLHFYLLVYDIRLLNRYIQSFSDVGGNYIRLIGHMELSPAFRLNASQAPTLRSYFETLREEIGLESTLSKVAARPLRTLWIINRAVELVILAERIYAENKTQTPADAAPQDGAREGMNNLLRYMYLHTGDKLTVSAVAKRFRVPEHVIRSYIKSMTGRGFKELLHEMRIGKISGYLLYTDMTLDEIASLMGYTDAPHLSKIFSEMTGMRISDYRRAYRSVDKICRFEQAELAYSIARYVYRHYSEPLSVNGVARQFGISATEVNRLLVSQAEKNFTELLNFARVNIASRLILSTDRTLIDISAEVGYASIKTFNRNFLRWRGMTPGEFRKTVKLEDSRLANNFENADD